MCQLTFTDLNNINKNAAVVTLSAILNADHNAPHGFGIWNGIEVWKTAERASDMIDLGEIVKVLVQNEKPIFSHVRLASKGVELKVENNHPFETKHFVGAHNGTLFLKEEDTNTVYTDNSSRGSDSERFFSMLEEEYVSNGYKFIHAITTVMEKHKGKFAFIIYEKNTSTYYIIRGKTADLNIVHCFIRKGKNDKYIGFIVNTEADDLRKLTFLIPNIWGLMGETGDYLFSKIEELKKETIYKVKGNTLEEVTGLIENPTYVAPTKSSFLNYGTAIKNKTKNANKSISLEMQIASIVDFQNKHFLSPEDMDLIFYKALGVPVIDVDEESIDYFLKFVLSGLKRNKAIRKLIRAQGIKIIPYYFYTDFGLEFPWMLNSPAAIEGALRQYENRIQVMRNKLNSETSSGIKG